MEWKKLISVFAVAAALLLIAFGVRNAFTKSSPESAPAAQASLNFDPFNARYLVNGEPVVLVNGEAALPTTPGTAAQAATSVFGEPAIGDLNGDGVPDAALILVQSPGGSGTFYYVVAAINSANGAQGTNAILLGDRIAPQNISILNGTIAVNYADRAPGEPMTTKPSVGISKYLTVQGTTLGVIQ